MNQTDLSSVPAAPRSLEAGTEISVRVCVFTLAGECFAVDLRNVREVFEVESLTVVPNMPRALKGVTNLRGHVIPLVDLRPMLGLPAEGAQPYAIVICHGPHQVAVLIDEVPQILTVRSDQMLPTPSGGPRAATPFLSALLRMDDRMGGVVEVPTLLAYVDTGGT